MNKQSKTKIIALLLASNMVMSATSGLLTVTASATTDTQVSATNVATTDIIEDGQIIDTQTSNFTNVGEEGYSFEIDEDGVITGFDHYDTTVTDIVIPSEIGGTQVTGIGGYLFHYNMDITSVTISEGVTSIGESAFESCHNLISVTMSEGVISIGDSAFEYCLSLTSVTLPSSVTTIEYEAFWSCESLTDVYYSGTEEQWDNISVAEYNDSLKNATMHFNATNPSKAYTFEIDEDGVITGFERLDESVTDIVIPSTVNGKKVTAIGRDLFYDNMDITSVTISEGVTSIGESAFESCQNLTSITIPEGVISIGDSAFKYCDSLQNVTLPSTLISIGKSAFSCYEIKNVYYNGTEEQWYCISIGDDNPQLANPKFKAYAFEIDEDTGVITEFIHSDTSVTDIVIPSEIKGVQVTGIGDSVFYFCRDLTSITLPSTLTSIGNKTFHGCTSLKSLTIPSSVETIGAGALAFCKNLTNIDLDANNQNYSLDNGVLYNKDKTMLICYPAGKIDTSFTIPSSVTSIGVDAFKGCSALTSVTISSSVTTIDVGAFGECPSLTSVTIPNTVTSIGDYAFNKCESLTSITLPSGITSIGACTFNECPSLTSVTIPEGVTSIGNEAFYSCSSLKSVTIPEGVTSIGYWAFYGCSSLASVTIPSSLTSIGNYLFGNCTSLTTVIIPEGVESIIISAFRGCNNLENVTLPSTLKSIEKFAFDECTSLTDVYYNGTESQWNNISIDYWYNDSLKNAKKHFKADKAAYEFTVDENGVITKFIHLDKNVTEIVIPAEINGTKVTGIGSVFDCKPYITSVTIPEGVTSIGDGAFSSSSNLKSVTIPSSVEMIGSGAFAYCTSLTNIDLDANNQNYSLDNGVLYNKDKTTLVCYLPGKTDTSFTIPSSVTSICDKAFYYCAGLQNITIPEGVTSIGDSAFHGCTSLKSLTIPEGVTSIGDMAFGECTSLTSVTIPSSVTSIGFDAFVWCSNLTSVTIPSSVTLINRGVFYGCSSLTSVTIPNSVTKIFNYAFDGCENLKDVYYNGTESQWNNISIDDWCNDPLENANKHFAYEFTVDANGVITGFIHLDESVTDIVIPSEINGVKVTGIGEYSIRNDCITSVTISEGITSIGDWAFQNCSGLTSITLPSTLTSIGDYTFIKCTNLKSITIPEGVTSIGDMAFQSCSGLTSIKLPSTITTIKKGAFSWCKSLTSVTIPSTVTIIGYGAFGECSSLADVYYNGTQSQWEKIEIADNNDPLNNANKHFAYKFTVDANGVITSFTHLDENVTDIVIPAEINGTKVTGIGSGLFRNNKTITSVTIPEGVTSIGVIAFYYCTSLKSVTIPEGVTSIGDRAFYGCLSLTTVTIPSTLTSIGEYALYYCTSLTNTDVNANNQNYSSDNGVLYNKDKTTLICYPAGKTDTSFTIPSSVTSIGYGAFTGCKSLTSITIPEGVTSIGMATFTYCTGLTSVTIPSSVTEIGMCAFYECPSLTDVHYNGTQEQWDKVKIDNTDDYNQPLHDAQKHFKVDYKFTLDANGVITSFEHTDKTVKDIVIPAEIGGIKVTGLGDNLFIYNTTITSVTIPEGVTSIGDSAFYGCSSLTSITIPSSVKSIGNVVFESCSSLASVTIPDGVTSIGESAFDSCRSLISITLPSTLTSIGNNTFHGCTSLKSLTIPEGVTSIGEGAFGECSSLTSVIIPSSVTSIGAMAFYSCTSLTSVTIPSSVTSIGDLAFVFCINLTSVTISESVTSIGYVVFGFCVSLTNIDVNANNQNYSSDNGVLYNKDKTTIICYPAGKTDTSFTIPNSVTSICNYAFAYCTNLTSVTIPNTVTTIDEGAFGECPSLTDVHYNGTQEQWDKVKIDNTDDYNKPLHDAQKHFKADKADYEFTVDENGVITEFIHSDTSVTDIVIPAEINGVKVTGLGDNLFSSNKKIKSVTISEGITSIGACAFESCVSLENVTLPSTLTSIGDGAFYACTSLTSVTIPEGVTSIGNYAFIGCENLISVTLPSTLTKINYGAFYVCPSLTDVHYNGTKEQWDKVKIDNKDEGNQPLLDATKHYNNLAFAGASLTLQNNISVNYFVDKLAFDKFGYTELSATFTLNDRITVVDKYTTSADGKYYVFTFSGIAPQMMGDTITATLSATYNGKKVTSKVKEYSILQYCNNQLEKSDIKAELKTLIVDLLNYGSMSQKGVNHNADNLVNAGLTADEQQEFVNWAKTNTYTNARNVTTNVTNSVLTWTGASLNLNDSIDINVYFTMANADVKSIVVKDKNNKIVDTITKFVDVDNNEKMAKFNKLIVSQLSDIYTFTAYDNNDKVVSNTLTYSVESYAYAKQNSTNKDLVNLVNAMMKYGESAKAYAETIKK